MNKENSNVKIVIEIPERVYIASQLLKVKHEDTIQLPLETIAKGTPYDETVTDFADRCKECGKMRKGHWIDNTDLGYHVSICSKCNWRGHGDTYLIYKPNYCPNCGAKMEERDE